MLRRRSHALELDGLQRPGVLVWELDPALEPVRTVEVEDPELGHDRVVYLYEIVGGGRDARRTHREERGGEERERGRAAPSGCTVALVCHHDAC